MEGLGVNNHTTHEIKCIIVTRSTVEPSPREDKMRRGSMSINFSANVDHPRERKSNKLYRRLLIPVVCIRMSMQALL